MVLTIDGMHGCTLDEIFETAWKNRATDVLLTSDSPPVMRVEGRLRRLEGMDVLDHRSILLLLEGLVEKDDLLQFHQDRELDFSLGWRDEVRVRGNAYFQQGDAAVALRIIPDRIPGYDELGIPESVQRLTALPQGLVLFTGPTGSGKSTSMAAMLDAINRQRACHILTIEDPVEYVHRHRRSIVSQRSIGGDTHSWSRALRAALREDPDVILVGEMRDPESIEITLTLAETGHLVFSTLHTNDASQALDRIVDVFPAESQGQIRVQLAGSLSAVIAQRLVPRVDGGMVAAYEVLVATHAIRNLIREGKSRQIRNVLQTGAADGMQTLEMSLAALVRDGVIDRSEAIARSLFPQEIDPLVHTLR